ncbi:alpha/beta hydrolase [Paenibacillus sp. NPDC058071]|uniref:alpha/beta hydrolase n=1 Tax=Paenibacillus sp. NPDC058071 TaxID=3346326 RepID=UPI0036DF1EDB
MSFMNRVDPQLRVGLQLFPTFELNEQQLAMVRGITFPPQPRSEHVLTTSRMIVGAGGQDMLVKIYEPIERKQQSLPGLLWIHGGGYLIGHPDMDDALCEAFVDAAHCVVVSVDYRLAPEHPYPAAIKDCYAALQWTAASADELRIDLSRLGIAGASAGGGLTAALALMARDKGGPALSFQMPLYPMIDHRNTTPSSHEITDERLPWNRQKNITGWRLYLGDHAEGEISPYAAAAMADDLRGLPPTYTCVGQLDPFRDETIDYVARLAQAGVDVKFELYPGCFHGFESIMPNAKISQQARNGYIGAVARALNPEETVMAAD